MIKDELCGFLDRNRKKIVYSWVDRSLKAYSAKKIGAPREAIIRNMSKFFTLFIANIKNKKDKRSYEFLSKLTKKGILGISASDICRNQIVLGEVIIELLKKKFDEKRLLKFYDIIGKEIEHNIITTTESCLEEILMSNVEKLRESEAKYRNLFENSIEGIGISKGNRVISANKSLLDIFGYKTLEEFVKVPILDHVAPEYRKVIQDRMKKREMGKSLAPRYEYKIIRKDGKIRDIEISTSEIFIGNDRYIQSTFRDITERKKVEEELRESRKLLQTTYDSILDAVISIDENYNIISCNKSVKRILGYTPDELIGKNYLTIVSEDMLRDSGQKNRKSKLFKNGYLEHEEYYFKKKSGEVFPASFSVALIKDEQGKFRGMVGTIHDITKRKKAEEKLLSIKNHLETVINGIEESIVVIDKNYNIISHNKAFVKSLRYPTRKIVGGKCYNIIHRYKNPCKYCVVRKMFTTGKPWGNTHSHILPNKKKIYHEVKAYPLEVDGKINQAVYIFRDVTRRKTIEEELRESEDVLDKIIDNALDAIFVMDFNGNYVRVNKEAEKLTEYSEGELLKLNVTNLMPKHRHHRARFTEFLKVDMPIFVESDLLTKSGEIRYVEQNITRIEHKGKGYLVCLARDVTEKRKAEEELIESEERFRTLVETANDGIWEVDKSLRIAFVNKKICEMLGYKENEMFGKNVLLFFSEDSRKKAKIEIEKRQRGIPSAYAAELRKKNGHVLPVIISATPRFDDKNRFNGAFGVITDITEIKRAEEELRRLDKMKDEFLAMTSHELKTPVTTIGSFTESLLNRTLGHINEKQREILGLISQDTKRLGRLIDKILELSKLQAGMMRYKMKKISINNSIKEAVKSMRPMAHKNNIKIIEKLQSDLPFVKADNDRMGEVIRNLIDNAIKFTTAGGKITIESKKRKNDIMVKIKDTGVGIPKEDLERIFEVFYQIDQPIVRKLGGVGLGLAISKRIVEGHNGRIWAKSKLGGGSTFQFILPIR